MSKQILKVRVHSGFKSKHFRMCSCCHLIKRLSDFFTNQWYCKTCRRKNKASRVYTRSDNGLANDLPSIFADKSKYKWKRK